MVQTGYRKCSRESGLQINRGIHRKDKDQYDLLMEGAKGRKYPILKRADRIESGE